MNFKGNSFLELEGKLPSRRVRCIYTPYRQCERVHIPCFQKHLGDLNCQHEVGNYLPGSRLGRKKEEFWLLPSEKITSFVPFCECKNKNQFTTISFKNISFATIVVSPGRGVHILMPSVATFTEKT